MTLHGCKWQVCTHAVRCWQAVSVDSGCWRSYLGPVDSSSRSFSPAASGSSLPADLFLRRRPFSFPSFLLSESRKRRRWLSAEAPSLVPCPRWSRWVSDGEPLLTEQVSLTRLSRGRPSQSRSAAERSSWGAGHAPFLPRWAVLSERRPALSRCANYYARHQLRFSLAFTARL